jgi:hypothetical protein
MDLVIGQSVHVYGRNLLLTNCDEYSRQFYNERGVGQQLASNEGSGKQSRPGSADSGASAALGFGGQYGIGVSSYRSNYRSQGHAALVDGGAAAALGFGGQYGIGVGAQGRVNTKSQARVRDIAMRDKPLLGNELGKFVK